LTKKFSVEDLIKELDLSADDLPDSLAEIAKVMEKHVPGRGIELALILGREYRSTYLYFHNFDRLERKLRDRLIVKKYSSGIKASELARWAGISERHVWSVLGKEPEEEKQMRMF